MPRPVHSDHVFRAFPDTAPVAHSVQWTRDIGADRRSGETGGNRAMDGARTTGPQAWLTAEEAARAAGVSRQTVYVWIGRGWLHPLPSDDGQVRIAGAELAGCLATRRTAAAVGVRVGTLRGWAAAADAGEAP